MIEVNVTTTLFSVNVQEVENPPITVTSDNVEFRLTSQETVFNVINETPKIVFSTDGGTFDFASKFRGEWVSGTVYYRNDIVSYEYSLYILRRPLDESYLSTTPPPDDEFGWVRFYWHEAPMQWLTATSATIGTATITTAFIETLRTRDFYINDFKYPSNTGTIGQVLSVIGPQQGGWVNLGDLVFWNLSDDLQTNGFNIVTGQSINDPNPRLVIGSGGRDVIDPDQGFKSYIALESVPRTQSTGQITIKGFTTVKGNFEVVGNNVVLGSGGGSSTGVSGNLRVGGTLSGSPSNTPVKVTGIRFPDGTEQFTAGGGGGSSYELPPATTATLGGIIVGDFLKVTSAGRLSVDAQALGSSTIPIATRTTLGGIVVGSNLAINTVTGVLNVLPATTATLGIIKAGQYLEIDSEGTLSVNIQDVTTAVSTATIGYASKTQAGLAQVGSGLSVAGNGIVSFSSVLESTLYTDGFEIRTSSATNNSLVLNGQGSLLQGRLGDQVRVTDNLVEIRARDVAVTATNNIFLQAPEVTVGQDIYESELQVSKIYNYSGVGPPLFPAGVQYPDQTVQFTAYNPNDMGPFIATGLSGIEQQARVIDFNNLTLAVDYNLISI